MTARHAKPPQARPSAGARTPPRRAAAVVLLFSLLTLLLNSATLSRTADRLQPSWRRDVAVAVTDAAQSVAEPLHLGALKRSGAALRRDLHDVDAARVLRTTADSELTVLLVGDSVMEDLSVPLAEELDERLGATTISLTQRGLPLGTPQLFDWPRQVRSVLADHDVDIVLVMIGATPYTDRPLLPGDDGYGAEYEQLAAELLDAASSTGAVPLWILRPLTGDPAVEAERLAAAGPVERALDGTPGAAVLDLTDLFATPGGDFRRHVRVDGRPTEVFRPDMVHLTAAGSQLVSARVVDLLKTMLPDGAAGGVVIR